jgi:hypothetical protein
MAACSNHLSITQRNPAPLSSMLTRTADSTSDVEDAVIGMKIRVAPETARRRIRRAVCDETSERVERKRARPRHNRLLRVDHRREDGAIDSRRRSTSAWASCLIDDEAIARTMC